MNVLLIFYFMFNGFIQKWYIPQGVSGFGNTRIQILDTDRDGNLEFVFTTYGNWPNDIFFYELLLPNTWEADSVITPGGDLLWDSGDFDSDGLFDLALQFHIENPTLADGIMIYESPDSFSYPTQELWRDTVGPPLVLPICVYDIDQDSIPEIVKNRANDDSMLIIYESVGNNQYDLIFADNPDTSGLDAPAATIAFGDFDLDGKIEFVPAGADDWYWIYECIGDNTYEKIIEGQLPTNNIRDGFAVPDADGDGRMEFVLKGFRILSALIDAFIFEATGDNTYEIIQTFTLPGGDYYGGYSDAGDVDGDSIPEIVLEARQNVFIIKAGGNDSFYVWDTLPGNTSGSDVRVTDDIDGNGYNEIVISGNNETRIYEYEPGGIEEKSKNQKPKAESPRLEVYPNPFFNRVTIKFQTPSTNPPNGMADQTNSRIQASLKIYDATGRLVKDFSMLTDYYLPSTTIQWDGTDDFSKEVPTGVYFLQLESKDSNVIFCGKLLKIE